jgi:hypothetical protein
VRYALVAAICVVVTCVTDGASAQAKRDIKGFSLGTPQQELRAKLRTEYTQPSSPKCTGHYHPAGFYRGSNQTTLLKDIRAHVNFLGCGNAEGYGLYVGELTEVLMGVEYRWVGGDNFQEIAASISSQFQPINKVREAQGFVEWQLSSGVTLMLEILYYFSREPTGLAYSLSLLDRNLVASEEAARRQKYPAPPPPKF